MTQGEECQPARETPAEMRIGFGSSPEADSRRNTSSGVIARRAPVFTMPTTSKHILEKNISDLAYSDARVGNIGTFGVFAPLGLREWDGAAKPALAL